MALNKNNKNNNQNLLNPRLVILVLIGLSLFLRQDVYRLMITYRIGPERFSDTQMDAYFERYILTHPDVYDRKLDDIDKIIHVSLKVTADALSFNGVDSLRTAPLSTLRSGETNSIGYAAFFTTVCTYLIKRFHLDDQYHCVHYIAERLKGGMNLHDAIQSPYGGNSPFNKTRDVVAIVDSKTSASFYVDPTLYDQFNIVYINVAGSSSAKESVKAARISRSKRRY